MRYLHKKLVRSADAVVAGLSALIAILVLLLATATANASFIYTVERTVGDGTISGFIETDETLGNLFLGNVIDWSLTGFAPNIDGGTSWLMSAGDGDRFDSSAGSAAFIATPTELQFDFSLDGATGLYTIFQDDNNAGGGTTTINFWCLDGGDCSDGGVSENIGWNDTGFSVAQIVSLSGLQSVATRSVAVAPLPAALPLFGTGLGILGFLGWRRRRQAQAV